ncbi:MAG: DUF177 domain-containing protein [Rhizobiaceae bacterium]
MSRHAPVSGGSPVSFDAHVLRLPRDGLPVVIEADEKQRAALAKSHGLLSVESWIADLTVTSSKRHGVRIEGRVVARITQACVVTLDDLATTIDEEVSASFYPEESRIGRDGFSTGGEMVLDPEGDDAPETFSGSTIDVGAVAEQFFALAIDPYPRKTGAELIAGETGDAAASAAAFARLSVLKPKS